MGTNFKFYKENKLNDDTVYTFTSASTANASALYDNDRTSKLISVGSDDVTPEVWEFDFGSDQTIDAIWFDNHNIKSGNVQYWNGAAYVAFSPAINIIDNTKTTNFYEVTQVSTQKVRFTMNTTQTVDAQKYCGGFRALELLGELTDNPAQDSYFQDFAERRTIHNTTKGGNVLVSFGIKFAAKFILSDADDDDVELAESLKDYAAPFFIFPCGGELYAQPGFRLKDMYFVNYMNNFRCLPLNN